MTDRRRYIRASNEYCNWIEWEAAGRPERRSSRRQFVAVVTDAACAFILGSAIGLALAIIKWGGNL